MTMRFINPEPFVPDETSLFLVSSLGRYNSSSLRGLRDLPQLNMGADPILISVNVRQGCRQSNHGGINNANSNKFKRCEATTASFNLSKMQSSAKESRSIVFW